MPTAPSPSSSLSVRIILTDLRDILVSLQLTLVLLALSMVLVFAGTIDQVNLGIWAAQEKYFRSFLIYAQLAGFAIPVFPGGYTVGGLLLANLIAAHIFRFRFVWRKAGIFLTHLGLIVLLVGELLTGLWQEDFHQRLTTGETKNYAESFRHFELALVDTTDPAFDRVVSIPDRRLARREALTHPDLPFRVAVRSFYANSQLHSREPASPDAAAAGLGSHIAAVPLPLTHRPDERNVPSAIVELLGDTGSLGTFLVSGHLPAPQPFEHAGRSWRIVLRLQRAYQPFSLTLLQFSHDRYAGTEIPKNFSSRLRLTTADGRDDREVLVYMNNPLRYGGLTYYQAGFENDDRTTILQVVRNPSWLVPYIACALMTLGLTVQFTIHLVGFIRRRAAAPAVAAAVAGAPGSADVPAGPLPKSAAPAASFGRTRRPAVPSPLLQR